MEVQLIAFYLPQFHPIPENDRWWGKGFTEWTNVTRAKPLFKGHYQPHLPADLGFYDLRNPETREAQAELARMYGIHGFCYWHYWFNGKRLLERPFHEVLESGKPDFPFCLAWANEPWSRRWHGLEQDVLQPQTYGGSEDDEHHIRWLLRAFRDKRYIKLEGKPVFLIYDPSHLPTPERTLELWRKIAKSDGFTDLHIVAIKSHQLSLMKNWKDYGFDAELIFQPNWGAIRQIEILLQSVSILPSSPIIEQVEPVIVSYKEAWMNCAAYTVMYQSRAYATVVPQWDNSPRRKHRPVILDQATPEEYEKWLIFEIQRTQETHLPFIFLNAWNEWAEGNHLEPDQKYGHEFLQATTRALSASPERIVESICDVALALLELGFPKVSNELLKRAQDQYGSEIVRTILPPKLEICNIRSKNKEAVQYFKEGKLKEASTLLTSLSQNYQSPLTIQNLACVYFEQGKYEKALEVLSTIPSIPSTSPQRKLFEAQCKELLGRTSDALDIYLELLDEPNDPFRCKERIRRLVDVHTEEKRQPPRNNLSSIIIVTYNNLQYTKECLSALLKHTSPPYEVLLIDNASTDGTQRWLKEFCAQHTQCQLIENSTNRGYPCAVNQGLRIARGENIVLLNNDVVVMDGWLDGLLRVAHEHENAGLVGPMTNEISGAQKDRTAWYVSREHMELHARLTNDIYRGMSYEATRLRFFCVLITKKALELCGGLDERFTPGNYEDDDYCLRVQKAGLKVIIARGVFVHHYGSKSFSLIGEKKFQDIIEKNGHRFIEKWGIEPRDIGTNSPNERVYPVRYPISSNPYREYVERALMHIQANEMEEAAKCFELALEEMHKENESSEEVLSKEDLYNFAGKVYLGLGNLQRARELFELELKTNPTSARACASLGKTFSIAELYEASKTMYEYAVLFDGDNDKVRNELARVNELLGYESDHNTLTLKNSEIQGNSDE